MNIFWNKLKTESLFFESLFILSLFIIIGMIFLSHSYSYRNTEISDDQYKELYIECQQSIQMRVLTKEFLKDNKITIAEFNELMQYKLLQNRQVLQFLVQEK